MISLVARGIASLAGRLATRNPRLGKKIFDLLRKKPTEGITLYRGQPARPMPRIDVERMYTAPNKVFPWSNPILRKQAIGRWFTSDPKLATNFAGSSVYSLRPHMWKNILDWGGGYRKGVVKKVTVSAKEAKLANRLMNKVHNTKNLDYAHIISKQALKRAETDKLRTFIANFYRMIGKKKGGLAQILNI